MDKKDFRIIYMGTPEFAVEALKALIEQDYNIVGVVTMPDKPMGRHQSRMQPSAVKEYALSQNLPVLQPQKLKDPAFIEQLRALKADLQIVVAFRMLPEIVWAMPRYGTFNIHASLLPQYRGAAPINWAIINGEKESGLTTFFLTHDIDTGDIVDQIRIPIGDDCTFGELHDRLMHLSASIVTATVDRIINGSVTSTPQTALSQSEELRPAPKIFKETCRIDIHKPLDEVYNFVRGLSPAPGAWATMDKAGAQCEIKILGAQKILTPHQLPIGYIQSNQRDTLDVALKGGFLRITELQLAGKKRMPTKSFLCGFNLLGNERLV